MRRQATLPTIGEIARQCQVPVHRVEYVVRAHDIRPDGWAGNARVFSADAVALIRRALERAAGSSTSVAVPAEGAVL